MSATLKRPAEPAAFPSPERAELAHAIAAAADASARKVALAKAGEQANIEVRSARAAVERAEVAIADAKTNAARHLTDQAMGNAGEAPTSIRQARTTAAEAEDHLAATVASREALQAALAEEKQRPDFLQDRVKAAACAVIRAERSGFAMSLATKVAQLQREIVAEGSGLKWLAQAGVFPLVTENDGLRGQPVDPDIRHAVERMNSPPVQWSLPSLPNATPFAEPVGAFTWEAALQRLMRDATAQLPEND